MARVVYECPPFDKQSPAIWSWCLKKRVDSQQYYDYPYIFVGKHMYYRRDGVKKDVLLDERARLDSLAKGYGVP